MTTLSAWSRNLVKLGASLLTVAEALALGLAMQNNSGQPAAHQKIL